MSWMRSFWPKATLWVAVRIRQKRLESASPSLKWHGHSLTGSFKWSNLSAAKSRPRLTYLSARFGTTLSDELRTPLFHPNRHPSKWINNLRNYSVLLPTPSPNLVPVCRWSFLYKSDRCIKIRFMWAFAVESKNLKICIWRRFFCILASSLIHLTIKRSIFVITSCRCGSVS